MRTIVLLAVIGGLSIYGFAVPQVGLYAYIWFSLFRPDYVAYMAGRFNFGEWLAVALMAGSIRFIPRAGQAWLRNPVTLTFILLHIPIAISSYAPLMSIDTEYAYGLFLRMSVVLMFIPLLIMNVEDFKRLYVVTAVSLGTWGLWHGATGVMYGGLRIYGGIGGFMSENNTFACGLTMVIPFCWYSRLLVKSKGMKLLLQAMTWGSVATTILSFSRGAAVALVVILFIIIMQSKQRIMALAIVVMLGLGPAIFLVKDRYLARISTIATYEEDASAMSRIVVMKAALQIWRRHPFFGIGMGTQNFVSAASPYVENTVGRGLVVHNSYLQMLAQCGIFAFAVFVFMLGSVLARATRSAKRLKKTHPEYVAFPRAIQVSMIAYIICSFTQPRYNFDFVYMIVMYAAVWYNVEKTIPQAAAQPYPQMTMERTPALAAHARF